MFSENILGMEPKRILVVDDEPILRKMLFKIIGKTMHQAFEAEHGLAALEMYQEQAFDLVILDLRMPQMGGREFLQAAKERGWRPNVIMLTGHGELNEAYELLNQFQIHDFIQKPLQNPFQLIFGINNALEKRKAEDALKASNQQLAAEIKQRKKAEADLVVRNDQIQSLLEESRLLNQFVSQQNEQLQSSKELLVHQKKEISFERKALAEEMQRLKRSLENVSLDQKFQWQWLKKYFDFLPIEDLKERTEKWNVGATILVAQAQRLFSLLTSEVISDLTSQTGKEIHGCLSAYFKDAQVSFDEAHQMELLSSVLQNLDVPLAVWHFCLENILGVLQSADDGHDLRFQINSLDDQGLHAQLNQCPLKKTQQFKPEASLRLGLVKWLLQYFDCDLNYSESDLARSITFSLPLNTPSAAETMKIDCGSLLETDPMDQTILLFDQDVLRAFRCAFEIGKHGLEVRIADQWDLVESGLREDPLPAAVLCCSDRKDVLERLEQLADLHIPIFYPSSQEEPDQPFKLENYDLERIAPEGLSERLTQALLEGYLNKTVETAC